MDSMRELYEVADEMRAVASLGLAYATNVYDQDRYRKVLSASARIISALDGTSLAQVVERYVDNLGQVSPLVGASAAVFRDGELLLMRRSDSGLWDVPGGLVDVGETLAEAALRELVEETGVVGRVARLLGIFDSRSVGARVKAHMFHVCFEVTGTGDPATSAEATEVGFFRPNGLPPLQPGADIVVPRLFELRRSTLSWFDSPH